MPTGKRRRRRRHRRAQHVAVARVDRACDAYAARGVSARETVGGDAPRFCERGAVWFLRARRCYEKSPWREERIVNRAGAAFWRWDSKRRLRISRERLVLDSNSVAIADADPTEVGARQARSLEEGKTIFVVAYFTREKLAHNN